MSKNPPPPNGFGGGIFPHPGHHQYNSSPGMNRRTWFVPPPPYLQNTNAPQAVSGGESTNAPRNFTLPPHPRPHSNVHTEPPLGTVAVPPPLAVNLPGVVRFKEQRYYSDTAFHTALMKPLNLHFGIHSVSLSRSDNNDNPASIGLFKRKRFTYVCGKCSKAERMVPITQDGCCGFIMKAKLEDSSNFDVPHLVVSDFLLPNTSKHVLVSDLVRVKHGPSPIKVQSRLSDHQQEVLKALGISRIPAYRVKTIMQSLFPELTMDASLMWRMIDLGRKEEFGDDDGSMVLFYDQGVKWKNEGGSFEVRTIGTQLHSWSGQTPLELKIKDKYADDVYFADTTHHACEWMLKTGPIKTVDCFGLTAPSGIMQVPEEDGESIDRRLLHLGLNNPKSVARTDAGSGWPYPIEEKRNQVHTEDPHHLHRNAIEISGKCPDRDKFQDDVSRALYGFPMDTKSLDEHIQEMERQYFGTGVQGYVKSLSENRHKRCFAYTCAVFICAKRGGASRAEQAMNIIKGGGTLSKEMRKWSISELMTKHESDVEVYRQKVLKKIEDHILKGWGFISAFVTTIEKTETEKIALNDLVIRETVLDAVHPFTNDSASNIIGIHYKISRRDKKYGPIDVFIPDDESIHASSNFYIHTAFWVRCRFIQRALLDHPTRKYSNISTLHKRWDIRGHPLYQEKYESLVETMKVNVDGLSADYLPPILRRADPHAGIAKNASMSDPTNEVSTVVAVPTLPVPTTQNKRYNAIRAITGRIEEYAKDDAKCFEMVFATLDQLRQNCIRLKNSSTSKVGMAAANISSKRLSVPTVPESSAKRHTWDAVTVNQANWMIDGGGKKKGGGGKKLGGGKKRSSSGKRSGGKKKSKKAGGHDWSDKFYRHCEKNGIEEDQERQERRMLSVAAYSKCMTEIVNQVYQGMCRSEWMPLKEKIQTLTPIENAGYAHYDEKIVIYRAHLKKAVSTRYPDRKEQGVVDLTTALDDDSDDE